jgi:hypothetical protein
MERILEAAAWAGAEGAAYVLLRLPNEVKDLFREWLSENESLRASRVMTLVRETRGGKLNDSAFHLRGRGRGAYADLIARRFRLATRRLGLNADSRSLDTGAFRPPPGAQLNLTPCGRLDHGGADKRRRGRDRRGWAGPVGRSGGGRGGGPGSS